MSESQPQVNPPSEPTWSEALALPLGLLGAIAGALLGGYVVKIAWDGGFYAIPIIGLTIGYGTIFLSRRKGGVVLTILAVLVCLAGSLLTEWKVIAPWRDPTLAYFVAHIFRLPTIRLLAHGAAAAIAGWFVWSTPARYKKST